MRQRPFAVVAICHPFAQGCTQADRINIIITKRALWYKRLIELPRGVLIPEISRQRGIAIGLTVPAFGQGTLKESWNLDACIVQQR
jgi:hypothetical protein